MSMIRGYLLDAPAPRGGSMDRLFGAFSPRRSRGQALTAWQPAVELFETDSDVVLRAEMHGIDPKNVDITGTDDTLALKGEAKTEHEERGRNYVRRELRHGSFIRTLPLPGEVKGDQAKASYKNGILEIRVPKGVRAKPKGVKVEVAE